MELHINMVAVLVAVVVNFFLGALWYMPLFGKAWATEMGFDLTNKPPQSSMVKGMIFMVIGNFLFAVVFAHNIAAWGFVPGTSTAGNIPNIMSATIFTWLGFYFPGELAATAWERHSWKLFAINSGYQFLSLLVAATILIMMK